MISSMDAPPGPHSPSSASRRGVRPDPFGRVLALGRHEVRVGLAIGIAGAFLVHGAAAAKGITTLVYMAQFASSVESTVQERLRATYDVNFEPPPEVSTPEEQPEEKQPEKTPPKQEAPKDDKVSDNPYDDPAPEAAQAGKVLTADPDPDAPLDLTGDGFVTGTGDHYAERHHGFQRHQRDRRPQPEGQGRWPEGRHRRQTRPGRGHRRRRQGSFASRGPRRRR